MFLSREKIHLGQANVSRNLSRQKLSLYMRAKELEFWLTEALILSPGPDEPYNQKIGIKKSERCAYCKLYVRNPQTSDF
jgi:anthranilate/para-aminobenzoate synthase component II